MAWAALPLAVALTLSGLSAFAVFGPADMTGIYALIALPVAAVLAFGGWERRRWPVAGIVGMLSVGLGAWVNVRLTVALAIAAGVPERQLLAVSAGLIVLGAFTAVMAGVAAALACNRGWLRRPPSGRA